MTPEGLPKVRLAACPGSRPPHGAHALQEGILQRTLSHRSEQTQQLPILPRASQQIARSLPARSQQKVKQLQGQEVGSSWVLLDCARRRGWSDHQTARKILNVF